MASELQPTPTHQATSPTAPIDPTAISKKESHVLQTGFANANTPQGKAISEQHPELVPQASPSIAPIDPTAIAPQGKSPTAIILAIAILLSTLIGSLTGLVGVVMTAQSFH